MSIRDDILQAMMDIAAYSTPKEIRLGIEATKELISRMEPHDFTPATNVAERSRFQGVPFRMMSRLAMDPDSWEVRGDRCEACEGRGFLMRPFVTAANASDIINSEHHRGDPCGVCNREGTPPAITGSIACE